MFLPRQTPLQPAQRPSLASTGSSASASAISIQVHETLLAAKARDLSKECGLGLADENSDVAHYVDSDDQGQSVESGHILSSEPLGAGSKHSADHLFVGGHPGPEHHQRASIVTCDALKPKRHSTKRASLRGYAEVQWKRHKGLRDRVLRATDVAKLEWEAKAALLHHSYPLAILLLFRAASLGSASACEQLANLYALGVTRGISPAVTLVYRDTLRSLAWILEALRLYERRLAAQIRAANLSTTPSLRLAQIWQGPLKAAQLLVGGLLSSDVAAFDPCQKNAVFLPVIDDLTDSQCAWSLRSSQNSTQSARQAPELWTELEDAIQRWTARLEAERTSASYDALILRGPDEVEEHQGLAAIVQNLNFHLCVLRAIQMTRFLILEPYAENIEPVEIAWTKAAQVKPEEATNCPDPALMLDVLSRAKGKSGRLYDEQLFRDLSGCVSTRLDGPIATEYKLRNFQAFERTRIGASEAKDKNRSPHVATQTKDRLRDLVPADVETAKQMDESTRPSLTMRLSSSHAAPQAAVVSISASGEHQTPMPSGVSASKAVRQKYGRSVSSSMASASSKAEPRASETASPSGSVRTGYSLSAARPRRPSSVVSVTPSLLFPPEISQDSRDRVGLASDENFPPGPSYRARSASSSHFASTSGIPRPRVSSMYSSAPVLVPSTSSIGLLPPSVSTTSQQNLNALASTNSTPLSVPSRRRTGSNASLASLNPRLVSILPKTSPSISEGPEASISSSSISKPVDVTAENPATKQSAAADTLRRLKGRRSYTDLHTFHSARNDPRPAPPMPSIPPAFAGLTSPGAPRPSTLQHSKSTVFVSMENLPDDIPSESKDSADKVSRNGTESVGSAMEHLARTQARISHQLIPSVLEEAEAKAATVREARPGPPFMSALAAGALSGLTVDLLFFPIDTIKTRLQSAQGFWAAGGFSGVYRGLASTAVGSAPGASVFFTTYESMKPALVRWMPDVFGSDGALGPAGVHMASASIAEVAACLIRVPTEVIKSRQQTMTYGKGTTTFQAFMKVFHEAGVRGYYRGFGSTVGREIPFTCIQFPLYERLKLEMARSRERSQTISLEAGDCPRSVSDQELVRNLPTWQAGLAGSIAGAIAAGLTTPLDVVKTRIMLHTKQSAAVSPASSAAAAVGEALPLGVNTSIIPTLLHIGRTEGIKTLFSGFLPRTMWIGLGGAVFLGTFDAGIKVLS